MNWRVPAFVQETGLDAMCWPTHNEAGAVSCTSLAIYGDGGNRTRVRETRSRISTSLVGHCIVVWGVAADRATPEPSRWEPKLPLRHLYRRQRAARWLFDVRSPTRQHETGGDVTARRSFCS